MDDRFIPSFDERNVVDSVNDCELDIYDVLTFLNNYNKFILQVLTYCEDVGLSFQEMGVEFSLIQEDE